MKKLKKKRKNLVLLLRKAYIDSTITDAFPDQITLAIECLRPILAIDEGNLFYMHPAVFIELLEAGLDSSLANNESLVTILKTVERLSTNKEEIIDGSEAALFFRKTGHFPERVLIALRKAVEEMHLARILNNSEHKGHVINLIKENGREDVPEKKTKPKHDLTSIDIEDTAEQDILNQVRKLNRRIRDFEQNEK